MAVAADGRWRRGTRPSVFGLSIALRPERQAVRRVLGAVGFRDHRDDLGADRGALGPQPDAGRALRLCVDDAVGDLPLDRTRDVADAALGGVLELGDRFHQDARVDAAAFELEPVLVSELLDLQRHDAGDVEPAQRPEGEHLVDAGEHLGRELGIGQRALDHHRELFERAGVLLRHVADPPRRGVGGEDEDDVGGRDARAVAYFGDEAVVPGGEEALVDLGMRLLEFVEQHDRFRLVAQRGGERAVARGADIAARLAEQARRRMRLAELAHVEEMEMPLVAEQLVGDDLGEIGLADSGRPGQAEHRDRLVLPPRRDAPAQLPRDGIDHVRLADDLGLEPAGQRGGVDDGELGLLLLVGALQRSAVGQSVENIHDNPRQSVVR